METKIFVIGIPTTFGDVAEKIGEALAEVFEPKKTAAPKRVERPAPVRREPCGCHAGPRVPNPEWEVCGTPANENLRFGAEFAVDEPMARSYTNRCKFLEARKAFDDFVDAGERCVNLGLARPEGVSTTRCNAIRQRVDQKPPRNVELIGETDWWTGFTW
jgi:hypothetical protein